MTDPEHTPLEELKAEIRNFIIGVHGDMRKVSLGVWTPEQFVLHMGLKIDKMKKMLEETK